MLAVLRRKERARARRARSYRKIKSETVLLHKGEPATALYVLIAGSLDTFGDFGNRFARNTILSNRYPLARQSVVQYVLMASNVLSIFIAQKILTRTMAKIGPMAGMGWWCILGNVASAIVQFALLVIVRYDPHLEAMGAFVVVWLLSQIFGFCSTLASMFL